ncbi:MAG: hypothetical protein JWN91_2888 [Nocardioides sp.]|nr:hypothetical protein [Nocardioides sp.]
MRTRVAALIALALAVLAGGFLPAASASASTPSTTPVAARATTPATADFPSGSLIIDMGVTPQTVANGLKPYGLVYELLTTYKVPVAWAVKNGKTTMGASDFTATNLLNVTTGATVASKAFAGGSFVVSGDFVGDIPTARLLAWRALGVQMYVANSPIASVPQYSLLRSWPRVVLDASSDPVADGYYENADIPSSAYRKALPSTLTSCDDLFVFPHADPTWTLHKNLLAFNDGGGNIFGQCHAPSTLENLDDPADAGTAPDMNFLSLSGMVEYGDHSDGTPAYTYDGDWSDPISQIMNTFDSATQNGVEQVYLPKTGWRSTTKVLAWDPDHPQISGSRARSPGKAAVSVYGRGFGDSSNGLVMYQGGHDFARNDAAANVAAQRGFLNFNLVSSIDKSPEVTATVPSAEITSGTTIPVSATATGGGGGYTYKWTSGCGGTFANSTAASTTFTAPTLSAATACTIRVTVTDGCGRIAFDAKSVPVNPTPPPAPSLTLTKTVADSSDADTIGSLGETLTYGFTVKNTGNVPLTNVKVTDAMIPALTSGAVCVASLAVGASTTCPSLPAATHTVSATDIGKGSVDNTATAAGTSSAGTTVTATDTATISTPATPGVKLTKTVADSSDADTIGSLGETLTYGFTVKNTGNVPLTNVKVTDAMIPALTSGAVCVASLAVGETTSCAALPAATHTVSATDIAQGSVDNTATVVAAPPSGAPVSSSDSATISTPAAPGISMTKVVTDSDDADTMASETEKLTYTFSVTNTGNVPLTNVKITDAMIPALASGATCVATLAVGAVTTCPALPAGAHTVTEAEADQGALVNSASAAATPPTGSTVTARSSVSITTKPTTAAITLTKTVADSNDADTIGSLGETLTYGFTVKNTGNIALTNVRVTDAMIPGLVDGADCVATLAAGATTTCPLLPAATHVVAAADITKGSVVNNATASATRPSGAKVTATDTATIATPATPALTMTKTVADSNDADSIGSLGETLTYGFTLKNTGNVPLTNVKVTDAMIPAMKDGAVCAATLAVGATTTCSTVTATHVVNAADIAQGSVVNQATATGTPSKGTAPSVTDSATIATPAISSVSMTKTVADSNDADVVGSLGETLTYTFTVKNTGNVPLTNVKVTDAMIPAMKDGAVCAATLAVGATTTCSTVTATHVVNAADIAQGSVVNDATATASSPSGPNPTSQASATIATPAAPAFVMTKAVADSADADFAGALGETLTYTFTVKNTGNVPLTNVKVTDATIPALAGGVVCAATLAVGDTTTCSSLPVATHTVSAADITKGSVDNFATASASSPAGTVNGNASATILSPAAPAISMTKAVADSDDTDHLAAEGEQLTYTFSVTNTGNVPLTDVQVTDAMIPALAGGAVCVASLAPGATTTCPSLPAATHTVTGAEADQATVVNEASATAQPPTGAAVAGAASATIDTRPSAASITLKKTVADSDDADALASEGERLTYSFSVTNTGNVALSDVKVIDAMIPALAGGAVCVASLAPGATTTCPSLPAATHTVTAAEVAHGSVENTASASAARSTGDLVTANDTAVIATKATPPAPASSISLKKTVADSDDADDLASQGEQLTYSFSVTNTGQAPLTNVTVTDPMIPALAGGALCAATLAVGETTTCPSLPAAHYTVTAADVDQGSVVNIASGSATPPTGADVTTTDSVVLGTYQATTTDPGPFSWDWQYDEPSCSALTVAYPSNIPDGQANDVNIRLETNLGQVTLNFHNNDAFWGGTTSFPYASHPRWPAGVTSYSVVWTQVGGTNYHWQGKVPCIVNDDGDPMTVDEPLAVTSISGWRTGTVTVKKGATPSADAVAVDQIGDEDLVLQQLVAGTWVDVKTVACNGESAKVTFARQSQKGTFRYRLTVDGSDDTTGAATGAFTLKVK